MKTQSPVLSPRSLWRRRSVPVALLAAGALLGAMNAQALLVTTLGGSFAFGPGDLDYIETASLFSYAGPGTLVGVRIELSGSADFLLTVTNDRGLFGTVNSMTEDVLFDLSGLPLASLSTAIPTYSVAPFNLAANSSMVFFGSDVAGLVFVELSAPGDVAQYSVALGAPATLPFQFSTVEAYTLSKFGSGISGGSTANAEGLVNVYYTVSTVPPPPVPEVSPALATGGFAALAALAVIRARRKAALAS